MSAELEPKTRLHVFLSELKTTLRLLKEVLLELKEVLVVAGLILFLY